MKAEAEETKGHVANTSLTVQKFDLCAIITKLQQTLHVQLTLREHVLTFAFHTSPLQMFYFMISVIFLETTRNN